MTTPLNSAAPSSPLISSTHPLSLPSLPSPMSPLSLSPVSASSPSGAIPPLFDLNLAASFSAAWIGRQVVWGKGFFQQYPLMSYPALVVANLIFIECAYKIAQIGFRWLPNSNHLTDNKKIIKDMSVCVFYVGSYTAVNVGFNRLLALSFNSRMQMAICTTLFIQKIYYHSFPR